MHSALTEKNIELYDKYVMKTYPKADILFTRGSGCHLWDGDGNEYLDFAAGIAVCSLGHCHPAVTKAITEQAQKLVHVSNLFMNERQPELAYKLISHCFDGVCFFCNSGAEANEGLIKLARKWGSTQGRYEIIAMNDSFHGRTLATLAATGRSKYRKGFEPDTLGFKHVPFNDLEAALNAIDSKTAAILLEPVQGEGGIIPAAQEYLEGLRKLCDEKGILLLFDEVQCGMGRTGTLFAWQGYGVEPDAFSLAKALGNGYPIAAMVAKRKHEGVLTPGTHASTFGGTPLASAAACAVVDTLCNGGVLENCKKQGAFLTGLLKDLMPKHACIKEVRGKGLMVGVVLDYPAVELLPILRSKGMIALTAGETVLRLVPPLIVTEDDCRKAAALIDAAISEHDGAAK